MAQPGSSSGYVTGKSPLDTSASRFSDSTWTSENHPDFPGPQGIRPVLSESANKGDQCGIIIENHRPLLEYQTAKEGAPAADKFNVFIPANNRRMSYPAKKSLFDTPQLPSQSLKCDLNLNSRPRLTSDYAQASQHAVLHSQPQSYATRRGILSYRRLEPMFRKVETKRTVTKNTTDPYTFVTVSSSTTGDFNANTACSDENANKTVPVAPVDSGTIDAVVEETTNVNNDPSSRLPMSHSNSNMNTQRHFFQPKNISTDTEVISSVLEFLKSPTTARLNGHQATNSLTKNALATKTDDSGKLKWGSVTRAVRPTTLENLKACTPKVPIKCHRLTDSTSITVDAARSPQTCRRVSMIDNDSQQAHSPLEIQISPLKIIKRNGNSQRSFYRKEEQQHKQYTATPQETSTITIEHQKKVGPTTISSSAWSPIKTERFFSRSLYLQQQPIQATQRPERQIRKLESPANNAREGMPNSQFIHKLPIKSPDKSSLSHQSSGSLNSDILEKVEGLIDDDFVDQPSLIASSKNSLDSETSRCSVNLQLQSLGIGMNRGMLLYHELARIKEQLFILRTTLEHCIVDEPVQVEDTGAFAPCPTNRSSSSNGNTAAILLAAGSPNTDDLAIINGDLRRQLVLLGEELKGRDATIRKLQQELASRKTPLVASGNIVNKTLKNVAVQTNS